MKISKTVKLMLSVAMVAMFIGCGSEDDGKKDTSNGSNQVTNNSGNTGSNNGDSNSNNDGILKASTIPFLFTIEAKGTNEIAINVAGLSNRYKNQPNYTVDWGDGTVDNSIKESIKHTYPNSGNYNISISGIYPRIFIPNLVSVEQWGDMQWTNMHNAFSHKKIIINASDTPDLSKVTDMSYMFALGEFNGDISSWDVSNVTNMSSMFYSSTFNQDISMWNTAKVKNMSGMFHFATNFNQDLSSWDVNNVTQMEDMFMNSSFNKYIGNWDVSNVENMSNMFYKNDKFNQDIGNWNISNVKNMNAMFYKAQTFNQNLGSWNLLKIEEMEDFMVNSGISTSNYDKTLIGWVKGNPKNFVAIDMGTVKYSKQGESARFELINKYHWLIRDGGLAK